MIKFQNFLANIINPMKILGWVARIKEIKLIFKLCIYTKILNLCNLLINFRDIICF